MTRNTAMGGGQSDDSLQKMVQLIIIDEVHLLNDERGAVIVPRHSRSLWIAAGDGGRALLALSGEDKSGHL